MIDPFVNFWIRQADEHSNSDPKLVCFDVKSEFPTNIWSGPHPYENQVVAKFAPARSDEIGLFQGALER